jgi:PAS domain S-box-containing protein
MGVEKAFGAADCIALTAFFMTPLSFYVGHRLRSAPVSFNHPSPTGQGNAEEEERFRVLLESLPNIAIQGYGPDGTVHYWNKANETVYGYSPEEALGKNLLDLIIPAEMRDGVKEAIQVGAQTGEMPPAAELLLRRKDGSTVPVFSSHAVVKRPGSEPELFCLDIDLRTIKDLEESVRDNEKDLAASLREKEVLLRELHHRVKNNMQFISSLLRLQSRQSSNESASLVLLECERRIRAMSLVHEKLYRNANVSVFQVKSYLSELVSALMSSYRTPSDGIEFFISGEELQMDFDTVIPCGLIITELVSNSIQHAFQEGESGEIRVVLSLNGEGDVELIVSDNGIGMAEEFGRSESGSMGLELVHALVRYQLEGALKVNCESGTQYTITFPMVDKEQANG